MNGFVIYVCSVNVSNAIRSVPSESKSICIENGILSSGSENGNGEQSESYRQRKIGKKDTEREKGRGVARKSSAKSMKVTKIMTYSCSECKTSSVYMYAE